MTFYTRSFVITRVLERQWRDVDVRFLSVESIDSAALGGVSILKGQSLSVSLETPSS